MGAAVTLEGVLATLSTEQRQRLAARQRPDVRARIEALTKTSARPAGGGLPRLPRIADLGFTARRDGVVVRAHIKGLPLAMTPNARVHWAERDRWVSRQREAVAVALAPVALLRDPRRVVITRESPGLLDTDNLAGACKAVRDEVAAWLGVTDAPGGPVEWVVQQLRAEGYGVRLEITGGAR